jgi:hypothetical protein
MEHCLAAADLDALFNHATNTLRLTITRSTYKATSVAVHMLTSCVRQQGATYCSTDTVDKQRGQRHGQRGSRTLSYTWTPQSLVTVACVRRRRERNVLVPQPSWRSPRCTSISAYAPTHGFRLAGSQHRLHPLVRKVLGEGMNDIMRPCQRTSVRTAISSDGFDAWLDTTFTATYLHTFDHKRHVHHFRIDHR